MGAWDGIVARVSQPRFLIGASLFRICAGLAIVIQYLVNHAQRRYLFGPDGLWPWDTFTAGMANSATFSVYAWSRSVVWFELCFHLGLAVSLLWLVGWRTRLTTPLTYVFFWSLHQRFPGIWDGGDNLMHLVLVYAMFADVGAWFSLDAKRRALKPADPRGLGTRLGGMFHNTAILAFALQISLVYGVAGLYKVQGEVWQDGTAIYHAFRGGQFVWPGFAELLYQNAVVVTLLSHGTVAFQVAFPFLLFLNRHTRRFAVALGLTFHLGIALFLGLITFSLFMASVDLALIDDDEYRALGRWLTRLRSRWFPGGDPRMPAAAQALQEQPSEPPLA
ncbi:HTTM domain-containing protein [Myxococcus sp. 1LA]